MGLSCHARADASCLRMAQFKAEFLYPWLSLRVPTQGGVSRSDSEPKSVQRFQLRAISGAYNVSLTIKPHRDIV